MKAIFMASESKDLSKYKLTYNNQMSMYIMNNFLRNHFINQDLKTYAIAKREATDNYEEICWYTLILDFPTGHGT